MKFPKRCGFYGILTNPAVGYEPLAALMVAHGVRVIQLRMKEVPRQEIIAVAKALRPIITGDALFIVNDDPETAAAVGADGVHIGQDDMPYEDARAIVGPDAIVGISTHTPAQTTAACALNPDYIGIGPVYATPTKKNPDPPIGIDGMQAMLSLATVPSVVLGSIDDKTAPEVLKAGAENICCVRYINQSPHPENALLNIIDTIKKF
ncbi:MAG: thiamine phosphate synthase [Myxococcota bacterium]|nr:thiamine phosphate synthase [Myxococcota bacterium]